MIKIAICDDEKYFQEQVKIYIEEYLSAKGILYEIKTFSSGSEFLNLGIELLQYSIIFLDINMDDINGIEVAQQIRTYSSDIYIVFVTAFLNYALDGYKVDATRYLLKGNDNFNESIHECMDNIFYKMNYIVEKKEFFFNEEKNIPIERIVYIESKLHKLEFMIEEDTAVLSVKNTCEHPPIYENDEIKTSKNVHPDEHGVGIKNIIKVIKKYNGSYIIQNNNHEFYFSILLPV